jgi:hypothetical protein
MHKFWADIFVGVACFPLMQAAVTGTFHSEGRGGGHVIATFNSFWLRTVLVNLGWWHDSRQLASMSE